MSSRKMVIKKLEEKVKEGKKIPDPSIASHSVASREKAYNRVSSNFSGWFHSTRSLLNKIELSDNHPIENFEETGWKVQNTLKERNSQTAGKNIQKGIKDQISILQGILEIYRDIETMDIKTAVAKGVYDNELDQARGLIEGNHLIPSAVITRSVLEKSLDKLVSKHGLEPEGEGINNKAKILWKDGPLSKIEYRSISKWAEVGNKAVHEGASEISHDDVAETIQSVEDFIERLDIEN